MRVKIVKVPDGPAPEWVRKEWVGVELTAEITPPDATEINFNSGECFPSRRGFSVRVDHALEELAKKSTPAAKWFRKYLPKYFDLFSFGPDEAEVLSIS